MNKGLIFLGGVVVGGAGAWLASNFIMKSKYEQRADEEIASINAMYRGEKQKKQAAADKKPKKEESNPDKEAATKAYQQYAGDKTAQIPENPTGKKVKLPYIIPMAEVGSSDYRVITIHYFTDGVVADDEKNVMSLEEIDRRIGKESLLYLDENDSVYVRNDNLRIDFEIINEGCKFTEYTKKNLG